MSKPKSRLIEVNPLTANQSSVFTAFSRGEHVICSGSAGTGKTFIALYLSMKLIYSQRTPIDHLVIVRSAVPTRDMGFLPGSIGEKNAVYEEPYANIIDEIHGQPFSYEALSKNDTIHFQTTSFLRGLTWDNCVVILDEAQNMSFHEINSVVTRLGENSRLIICGDRTQTDLCNNGFEKLLHVCQWMDDITIVNFTCEDIVRSDFVKRWIIACEEANVL